MNIKHHFFGKDCIIDRPLSNRQDINEKLKIHGFKADNLLFVNQVHGSEIVVVDELAKIHGEQNLPKADAIVTNLPNIAIAVVTADCSPILLFDQENNVIAAAHAGWRGARIGVIKATIAAMKNLGAKKITAIIGPMIHQDSYQISQEFFDDFIQENSANAKFFVSDKAGHYLFDLPAYVEEKLSSENIAKIENVKIDTYKNEQSFFSFRRSSHKQEPDCGRNVSVIMLEG